MRTARSEDGSPRDGNQQLGLTDTFWLDSAHPPGRLACEVISAVHNPGVSGWGAGHRLLVTWHPASAAFGPEALRPLLQQYGPIKALESVQDPAAGQTPGRATVTYVTEQAAVAAVAQLGQGVLGQQQLPPGLHSIQVQYVHQAQEPLPAQLESGQQPATAQQQQQQLLGQQYASACVPMQLQANEPYASLQQQHQLAEQERPEGSQQQQEPEEVEAAEQPTRQRHTLFFAKVPRSASRSALLELFSSFGEVVDINLFAEYPDAPVSKGCGLVTCADRAVALTVLQQLGGRYRWNGMRSPMVLKLMNPDQRKQQQQHNRGPSTSRSSSSSTQQLRSGMRPPCSYHHEQAAAGQQGLRMPLPPPPAAAAAGSSLGSTRQQQQPNFDHLPPGCSGDAYKLFVGNIPKSCSAATLRQLLERIGPVAEVVIIRDRSTSESKGSAFVWFNRAMHADQAIAQLNMRVILAGWQPSDSAHSRPLVVKRASQQWRCQLPPGEQVIAPHGTGDSSGSSKLVDTAAAAAAAVGVSGSEPAAVSVSAEEGAVVTKLPVLLQRPPPPALILAEAAPTGVTAPAPSAAAAARPVTGADLLLVPAYASTMGTVQQQQQQQHQIGYPQQQRSQALQQQPALMQQQIPAEHQILWRRQQQLPLTAMMQQVLLPQQQQQQQQQQPGSQHAAFQPVATLSSQLGAMQLQPQQQEALGILGSNHQLMKAQQQQQQQVLPGGAIPHAGVTHPLLPDYTLVASSAAAAAGTSLVLGAQQQGMILHAPRDPGSGQLIQQPQVQGYGLANVQGNLQTSRPGIKLAVQTNQPLLVQQHGIGGVQGYSQAGQVAAPTVQGYGMPGNLQLPVQGYTPSSQAAAAAAGVQGYGMPVPSMQANFQVAAQGYTRGLPVMASAVQGYVVPGVQGHPQLGVLGLATSAGVGAAPSTEGQLARLGPFGM